MFKNRGLGAILTENENMLGYQPQMTDLGTQYIKTLGGFWPNQSKVIGLITGSNISTVDGIRVYGKIRSSYSGNNTTFNNFLYSSALGTSVASVPQLAMSGDGNYLAVGGSGTSSGTTVELWQRTGATFTKLTGPTTMPTVGCNAISISSDGTYIAYTSSSSPYLFLFKRTGNTFTNLSNPSTMPTGAARSVAFSYDDNYLAVGHSITPFITVYSRSGDTFTKLSDPATLPTSFSDVTWCGNSYICGLGGTSTAPDIFKLSGGSLTKLTTPATASVGTLASIAGTSDSKYLVVIGGTSPFFAVYKINTGTDTFTKLTLASSAVSFGSTTGVKVTVSKDVKFICVSYGTNAPYATLYLIDSTSDTFTRLGEQFSSDGLTGAPQSIAFINAS